MNAALKKEIEATANYITQSDTLNQNERTVLCAIAGGDHYGDRPTRHPEDILDEVNHGRLFPMTKNQLKGYLGVLVQKDLIIDCELPSGDTAWQVL